MGVSSHLGLVATAFVAWYILSSAASWYRLRHIPGPKLASFSYLWVAWKALRGRGYEYEGLRKYGSLVRVSPNYIITDDPSVIRQINGARSSAHRSEWYQAMKMEPDNDNLVSSIKIGPHDARKAQVANAYAGRDHLDFEAGVDAQIKTLVGILRGKYISSATQYRPIDFAQYIRYFTLDVITDVGYGKQFGFMEATEDLYGYTNSVENLLGLISTAGDVPFLRNIFSSRSVSRFITPEPTDQGGLGKVMGIGQDIIRRRFEKNDDSHPDMIGAFMRRGMLEKDVNSEVIVQILAGSDTTATSIRSTMLFLMTCPRAYQSLKTEIKKAVNSGKASHPITNEEAKALPYLQAVIYEGLRMRPPGVYGFYKDIPAGGETISGKFIPAGTAVGWNMPAMFRRESIFGPDAQLFRPERYLECGEEKRQEMMHTVDLVFGHGRWMCAGKMLAFIELNKIFFELMREFDWQLVYPGSAWVEKAYTVWMQKDMWVSITDAT